MTTQNGVPISTYGKKCLSMIEFDKDERLVTEIRKHPFGLFVIYASGLSIAVLVFAVLIIGSWYISRDSSVFANQNTVRSIAVLAAAILTTLIFVGTAIAGYLYKTNVVLVTTDKLSQFLNTSIFNRKISQLSIGDVQDTTVSQVGIFARALNYGTLVIETAGEQQNYTFTYTPQPFEASKAIVGAHEENLKEFGN